MMNIGALCKSSRDLPDRTGFGRSSSGAGPRVRYLKCSNVLVANGWQITFLKTKKSEPVAVEAKLIARF